ncbi:MAG: hypothetical protein AAF361_06415 [Bacteroidota bacterium]
MKLNFAPGQLRQACFLALAPLALSAQMSFTNPEGAPVNFLTKSPNLDDVKAEGSPYLEEEFKYGRVYAYDSLKLKGEMRYNAYRSEIEVAEDDDSYFSLLKRPYISVEIDNEIFKMYTYTDVNNLSRVAYFNPRNKGKAVLLFKPEIKLRKGRVPSTSYDRYVPPTYIDISTYYIKTGEEPAERVRLKKKDIVSVLKNKKTEVVAYIKDEKLNMSKEADVIRLLNYYNTL